MPIVTTTPAQVLPVTLTMALRHVRALQDDMDLVDLYCRAAVAAVEDYTGRSLITQTYTLREERWPSDGGPGRGAGWGITRRADLFKRTYGVTLARSPLVAINSVKYYPSDGGARVTWGAANYAADTASLPGKLVVTDGVTLPDLFARNDALEIEFTAGYGTKGSAMPPMLQLAVLQLARHFFDNPSAVTEMTIEEMPYSFVQLLRSQKI